MPFIRLAGVAGKVFLFKACKQAHLDKYLKLAQQHHVVLLGRIAGPSQGRSGVVCSPQQAWSLGKNPVWQLFVQPTHSQDANATAGMSSFGTLTFHLLFIRYTPRTELLH